MAYGILLDTCTFLWWVRDCQDPVDRMLICQAIYHGCILPTPDDAITRYPVNAQW